MVVTRNSLTEEQKSAIKALATVSTTTEEQAQ
jgi:hypothetical protein